jgi:hypothetical protein
MKRHRRAAADDAQAENEEGNSGNPFDDVRKKIRLDREIHQRLRLFTETAQQFALQPEGFDQILRFQRILDGACHAAFLPAHGKRGAIRSAQQRAWQQETDGCA